MQTPTFLKEILEKKQKAKILNATRKTPLISPPLESFPFVIAEIKRASPSLGDIGAIKNPPQLAQKYLEGGASAISVLCEEDYFKGSLQDLKAIKDKFSNACVLRKDFITTKEQIKEAYDFGADMVLLIAAIFANGEFGGFKQLKELYRSALALNLTPLIEVHNQEEIDFITPLNAKLIGINSRNLHTFKIDKIMAFNLLNHLKTTNKQAKFIFESSISCSFDGFVAGNVGFDGILCGSYLVSTYEPTKNLQNLISSIKIGKNSPNDFYHNAFMLLNSPLGFIKICGITDKENALLCAKILEETLKDTANAKKIAALGFILIKESPRYISPSKIKDLANALTPFPLLKIAVVSNKQEELQEAIELYRLGLIDAIQLHGTKGENFASFNLKEANFPFYEVKNIASLEDLNNFLSPFVLLDSKSTLGGGSGKSIDTHLLLELKEKVNNYLCVAGGVGLHNLKDLKQIGAKMLDVNSSLESKIGIKDPKKLKEFLESLKNLAISNTLC
ncbi:bifunctional indole-3-glycerol phosphate synthase/phosphoribosylanthranilate isomerase [Helicobacter valdiviensis]|uniref:N-(5'-phosphoribosyl)anthranilate isomerase n=1 Tax=Helicobacter valdiviensis TaxID=1458358 RepID=A0A2W6MYU8_9HELI|nr:bifunctional indole-3-glycerol phosphate synthase/phosphoribosylanthranilate isomerase [Helicobacter valdiviensis]PZT48498.1 bifunctional indole-3-glycerol phosphate synthase/phosphoribosylanthranilate isomerase [Helicobacter valdiviensis]